MIANTFVGPPLGGVLLAVSAVLALSVATGAFALAAVLLLLIPGTFRPAAVGPRRHLAVEIRDGLSFLGQHPLLRTLSSMTALQHAGLAAVFTVMPLYALAPGPVGLTPGGFGLLLAAWGAGALAGAAVAGDPGRPDRPGPAACLPRRGPRASPLSCPRRRRRSRWCSPRSSSRAAA